MTISEKLLAVTEFMSRVAISRKAGLSPSSFHSIVTGRVTPNADSLLRIARVLRLDPGWLLDDSRGLPIVYTPHKGFDPMALDSFANPLSAK